MNNFIIIGANASICELIKKAKEHGFRTHVFAWKTGDPGEIMADVFHPIDIADKEAILKECKLLNPVGIASITSDFAYGTVNYVARHLKLSANLEKSELLARNKYEMRKAFKEVGLFTPQFQKVRDRHGVDMRALTFPAIVKPIDGWSSKGVTRVDEDSDLEQAIKKACSYSSTAEAIIEDYIKGSEYSCECLSYKGGHRILAFTKKFTTGSPNYIEVGHCEPASIMQTKLKMIQNDFFRALDSLGIQNGASHIEFKIMDNGTICIIEIGARMGGDCIGTHLVPMSTGIDYVSEIVRVACGKAPQEEIQSAPYPAEVRFFFGEEDRDMCLAAARRKAIDIIELKMDFDNCAKEITNSSERLGHCVYYRLQKEPLW